MATHGAADSYYTNGAGQPPMQPQMQYPPQAPYNNGFQGGPNYPQAPPNYGENYQTAGPAGGGKQTFEQAFKLDKPKYNDLWAGILVGRLPSEAVRPLADSFLIAHPNIPWLRRSVWSVLARLRCEQEWKCWERHIQ